MALQQDKRGKRRDNERQKHQGDLKIDKKQVHQPSPNMKFDKECSKHPIRNNQFLFNR